LVGVAFACRRAGRDRWALVGAALVVAFALFAVPVWIRGSAVMRLQESGLRPDGSRYLVAPTVVVISSVAVLVDGARRSWLRTLLVAHSIMVIVVAFQLANPRSTAIEWD